MLTAEDHDLLMRIDERTEKICDSMESWESRLKNDYVSQSEFWPIKTIVYGGAGIVLVAVMTAIVALVVKGGHI